MWTLPWERMLPPLLVAFLCSCANIEELHYLQSVDSETGKPANYFRLRVTGRSCLSSTRYVAGYYDERAVDLFFNQLKREDGDALGIRPLFVDEQEDPGTDEKVQPLSPTPENGAFVMVMSTNAKAVTDTIGQFAESQIAADAIANLVNRSDLRAMRAELAESEIELASLAALAAELEALFVLVPEPDVAQAEPTRAAYLRVLNAIAASQGAREAFGSIAEARTWFDALRASRRDR